MATNLLKQAYLSLIPAFPIGYIVVHGFRGDQIWSKLYVERSRIVPSDHLKELVEQELDRFDGLKNPKVAVYLTDNDEPKVYGGLFLNPGAELQFPVRMSIDDMESGQRLGANIEMDAGLAKHRRKIELRSNTGEELLSRMVLSEAAKKFLIQRQLTIANSGIFFCAPILTWLGVFSIGYVLMAGMITVVGPIVAFVVSTAISIAMFSAIYRISQDGRILKADADTVKKGDEYLNGARDYFTAGLKFNRLMRKVMGEEGETNFAKSGDVKMDRVNYSTRLRNIEQIAKEIQFENDGKKYDTIKK